MSFVSKLFDDPERVTDDGDPIGKAECGTHGGVARHSREGEPPCAECMAFKAKYNRGHYDPDTRKAARTAKSERPEAVARGTTKAAEQAKALEAHRRECAPLRAEVRAMIAAEKRSA